MAASIFTLYRRRGVRLYTDGSRAGVVCRSAEGSGRRATRPGSKTKQGRPGSRSVLGGQRPVRVGEFRFSSACIHSSVCHCAEEAKAKSASMQTVIRCTPICTPHTASMCRCLYHIHLPGCYILTLDVLRRYRSASLRYAPRKRLANVCETALVVFHLRIPVLRRLCVPHGLAAAPCSMSASKPLLVPELTQKRVPLLLQPSSHSSPPPAVPPR